MPANVDAMVRAGVEAFRAGKKAEARTLLERAIELDGYNETAWLWLSAVVESPEEQQTCLENVLTINPNNERAKQGLKSLGINPNTSAKPAAASSAPAFEMGTFDFDESEDIFASPAPTKASSPSPAPSKPNTPSPAKAPAKPVQDDLFGDVDFSADASSYEIDDSLFGDDPYGTDAEDDYIDDELFDDGDDMYADINTLDDFDSQIDAGADYDDSIFADDPFAPPPAPKAAPAAARSGSSASSAPMADFSGGSSGFSILSQIPAEIETGRMPGTNEAAPSVHYLILGVLALLNIGALFFVAFQFVG